MFLVLLLGQVAGVLFGSAVDHVAGQVTDSAVGAVRARLARGRVALPQNHDLERAHRSSLRHAMRYLLAGVLPMIAGRPLPRARRWWAGVRGRPLAGAFGRVRDGTPLAWCRQLERAMADDDWVDAWSLGTLETEQLEVLAAGQVSPATLSEVHELVVARLAAADLGGTAPPEVLTAVRAGWQVSHDGTSAVVTLFGSYCLFFQAVVAHDPVVASKVAMNSRDMLLQRHGELMSAIADTATDPAAVVDAVRAQVGPALAVLGDRLQDLSRGVADVAVELAAQTTALARLEDAVGRVDTRTATLVETASRVEVATQGLADTLGSHGETADRTLAAVTEIATMVADLQVRGRPVSAEEVQSTLDRYRSWVLDSTGWLLTEARTAEGERLRLPLSALWVADIPLVRRVRGDQTRATPAGAPRSVESVDVVRAADALFGGAALVTGGPGSGKSTMLRWLAHTVAGHPFEALPPVLVSCRTLRGDALTGSVDALVDHALRSWGALADPEIEAATAVLVHGVLQGRALLALDGLDEIADGGARLGFAEQVGTMIEANPDARVVVTTRESGAGAAVEVLADRMRAAAQRRADDSASADVPVLADTDREPVTPDDDSARAGGTEDDDAIDELMAAAPSGQARERAPAFEVAPLDARHRLAFLRSWGAMRGMGEDDVDAAYGPLLRAVAGDGDVAVLGQNVFMLSLLAHAQDAERQVGSRSLPVRRRELFRRVVEYRVAGQRGHDPEVTVDELVPRLEHVALRMLRSGELQASESDVVSQLTEFDETVPFGEYPSVAPRRGPAEVLAVARALGLLVYTGPGPTRRGIAQDLVQFFHQAFGEYFAGNGMVHRWCETGSVVGEVRRLVGVATTSEPPGLSPVTLESLRHAVDRLDAQHLEALWFGTEPDVAAEQVLRPWLAESAEQPGAAASLLSIALLGLAGASELTVPHDLLTEVLTALERATTGDASPLHDGVGELLRSAWGDHLVEAYGRLEGESARRWGVLLLAGAGPLGIDAAVAEDAVRERLRTVRSAGGVARDRALLELIEIFYQLQACTAPTERVDGELQPWAPAGVGPDVKDECWEVLLTLAEQDHPSARLAAWALGWLTCSPRPVGDVAGVSPERRERVRALVRTSPVAGARDPFLVADLAGLLALPHGGRSAFALLDWTYLTAVVADGAVPRWALPFSGVGPAVDPDAELFASLAVTPPGRAGSRLAVHANRLGRYGDDLVEPLWRWLQDDDAYDEERDEAWFGLCVAGGHRVVETFARALETAPTDSYLSIRAVLGLVAAADVETLQRLSAPGPHYNRAYLLALAGHEDPRGPAVVASLAADHGDAFVREEAAAALETAAGWPARE